VTVPVFRLSGVIKDYRGLRPLRIESFVLEPGERTAILGLDQFSAETLVNLITGTFLPEKGDVHVFGRSTADIADADEWLATVDRIGIVTERAVLLDSLSVVQNLAIPLSLDIEPPSEDLRRQAMALGTEAGLGDNDWDRAVAELDGGGRARVLVGRVLALNPEVLLVEHVTARVPRPAVAALAETIRATASRRGAAVLALTADLEFADACADRVLTLEPGTGRLVEKGRGWLRRAWKGM
jgi:putative ABC transport system ATP-binding protein